MLFFIMVPARVLRPALDNGKQIHTYCIGLELFVLDLKVVRSAQHCLTDDWITEMFFSASPISTATGQILHDKRTDGLRCAAMVATWVKQVSLSRPWGSHILCQQSTGICITRVRYHDGADMMSQFATLEVTQCSYMQVMNARINRRRRKKRNAMQKLRQSGMDASSGMSRARPPTSGHLEGIRHMLHPMAPEWASPNDEI